MGSRLASIHQLRADSGRGGGPDVRWESLHGGPMGLGESCQGARVWGQPAPLPATTIKFVYGLSRDVTRRVILVKIYLPIVEFKNA